MSTFHEILASYVPSLVAHRFAADPTPFSGPEMERFPAAVLFTDISGFTPLAERLAQRGPIGEEELTRLLNAYFGQLITLIDAHGGEVVKFAGDALLALWSAIDEDLSTVTRRAAQCGLAVQATLNDYEAAAGLRLSMRVCIGAGEVVAMHVSRRVGRLALSGGRCAARPDGCC